jgi:alkanesulfonate monooxygenase SsuD/methylene tetrahydromethanopterin reductase-like flavin-dependent oxidoreductase (luciferase family)
VRYGLSIGTGGDYADPRTLVELVVAAERSGWDAALLEDYIVYQSIAGIPTADSWTVLAAAAVSTTRILLGTAVTPLARRRPWHVAREVATVDLLSGGRALLGVGVGDLELSFTAFAEETELRVRAAMLDEALEIVSGLWTGEKFAFAGRHFQVSEIVCRPTPLQRPRVPIWVGGVWPRRGPVRRAARWDGALLGFKEGPDGKDLPMQPEDVRALVGEVRRLRGGSLDGYEFVMGGNERRPDEDAVREHVRAMASAGATWWVEWIAPCAPKEAFDKVTRGPLRI